MEMLRPLTALLQHPTTASLTRGRPRREGPEMPWGFGTQIEKPGFRNQSSSQNDVDDYQSGSTSHALAARTGHVNFAIGFGASFAKTTASWTRGRMDQVDARSGQQATLEEGEEEDEEEAGGRREEERSTQGGARGGSEEAGRRAGKKPGPPLPTTKTRGCCEQFFTIKTQFPTYRYSLF